MVMPRMDPAARPRAVPARNPPQLQWLFMKLPPVKIAGRWRCGPIGLFFPEIRKNPLLNSETSAIIYFSEVCLFQTEEIARFLPEPPAWGRARISYHRIQNDRRKIP